MSPQFAAAERARDDIVGMAVENDQQGSGVGVVTGTWPAVRGTLCRRPRPAVEVQPAQRTALQRVPTPAAVQCQRCRTSAAGVDARVGRRLSSRRCNRCSLWARICHINHASLPRGKKLFAAWHPIRRLCDRTIRQRQVLEACWSRERLHRHCPAPCR